jgi:hypothetical protein
MNRDRRDCHHVVASDATGRTAAPTSVTSNDLDPQQKAKPAAHAA